MLREDVLSDLEAVEIDSGYNDKTLVYGVSSYNT